MSDTRDATLALARLTGVLGETPDPGRLLVFSHPGVPVPKERARQNTKTGHWYTPGPTREATTAMAWAFKAALGRRIPFADTVALVALFYVPTRQPKDLDNLLKLVMDAGNASQVWRDDRLVIAQSSWIDLDPASPRTVVACAPCVGTMTRLPLLAAV